ncbi:MAG: glycosyltransferase [Deltaproteobacteria bacterium]|nr:glycosyltransferase [Deltaproteobacteria bacterium]MCB9785695.1 glycosyltransferase [Deltaproteobacteria bacterium]
MNAAQSWNDTRLFIENLSALEEVDPGLAARLSEPVGTEHVIFGADGDVGLRWRGETHPLAVESASDELEWLDLESGAPVIVFGVGTGDQLRRVLDATEETPVIAWERDPWLLGLAIGFFDFAKELRSGRLRLALGADLFDILSEASNDPNAIFHPLLTAVYRNEWRLFCEGGARPRALVSTGGALCDEVSDGLLAAGKAVYTLDLHSLSAVEIDHAIVKSGADLLVVAEYTATLAEFCADRGLRLLIWEVDHHTLPVAAATGPTAHVRVCTSAPARQAAWRDAGYEQVLHVPVGADVELRRPITFKPADMARYLCSVATVGPSLVDEARRAQGRFIGMVTAWLGRGLEGSHEAKELCRALLTMQRNEGGRFCLPEILTESFPDLLAWCDPSRDEDPAMLVGLVAASERRLRLMESLSRYRPHVWGDPGWRATRDAGVWYRGRAPVGFERNKVHVGAQVNVVLDMLHEPDHVPAVVFETMACGGLVLAPHSPALEALFEVGVEVVTWRNEAELHAHTAQLLAHPDRARRVAEAGLRAVRERHTISARLEQMLEG